jgi:hypothetical protein
MAARAPQDDRRPTIVAGIVAASLLAGAVALSPARVSSAVSLDWRLGDMTPVVQGVRLLLILGAAAAVAWRARLARIFSRANLREAVTAAALMGVSLSLTLVAAELVLRRKEYPFRGNWTPSESALARFDAELGWSYIPGLTTTQKFGRPPRSITMHFDSNGVRVDHPGRTFSRTTPSLLFIGDSFTFGHGVTYEQAFPALVEARLDGRAQTVNLGVQGYGTDQALLSLRRAIDRFAARVVVYTFISDHVQRNANYDRRVLYPDGKWPGSKPLFGVRADGTVFLRDKPAKIDALPTIHLVQVAQVAWARWGPRPDPALTTALLRSLKEFCAERGVTLLVVNWTWTQDRPAGDPRASDRAVDLRVLSDAGVNVLDLSNDAPPEWRTWRIPGDGHPTPPAHERAARLIAERLSTLVPALIPAP